MIDSKKNLNQPGFKIDFYELAFLTEACIPPVPIGRYSFWKRLIDEIYYDLDKIEREGLFNWIQRTSKFDKSNEDCQWFYARFNPDNQYIAQCFYDGKPQSIKCFKKDEKYWTSTTRSIIEEYITNVVKL